MFYQRFRRGAFGEELPTAVNWHGKQRVVSARSGRSKLHPNNSHLANDNLEYFILARANKREHKNLNDKQTRRHSIHRTHHPAPATIQHVVVNHCRADVAVTQQLLHCSDQLYF